MKKKKRLIKTSNKKQKVTRKKHIFSFKREAVAFTETDANIPVTLNENKTYRVTQSKNKFKIYELNRKQKPRIVKTVQKSKHNRNKRDVEANVKRGKLKLRSIYVTSFSKTEIVQTNYRPTTGGKMHQLVALVDVHDSKNDISEVYTCYSSKVYTSQEHIAIADLKRMAVYKFTVEHGQRANSKDGLETRVRKETIRYLYVRKKI